MKEDCKEERRCNRESKGKPAVQEGVGGGVGWAPLIGVEFLRCSAPAMLRALAAAAAGRAARFFFTVLKQSSQTALTPLLPLAMLLLCVRQCATSARK